VLSKCQLEIRLRAIDWAEGHDGRALAKALGISQGTLKWHLHNIYTKLGVRNRVGAVAAARRLGLFLPAKP